MIPDPAFRNRGNALRCFCINQLVDYRHQGGDRKVKQTMGRGTRLALAGAVLVLIAVPPAFAQTTSESETASETHSLAGAKPAAPASEKTQDEKERLAVNPVTGQTTAQVTDYTPLTAVERWKLYYKQSYWSAGAYFGPLFAALALDQAAGSPQQWGGGFRGYGRRVASRVASGDIVQNSFQFPVAALLKEDVRYIASNQHGFGRRVGHAVLYSFLTYNSQGRPTLNIGNIGGYYFAGAVSTLWLPGRQKVLSYTFTNGSEALGLSMPVNMIQEFWPEIVRTVFRRHRGNQP
jgi:hypothetical protein